MLGEGLAVPTEQAWRGLLLLCFQWVSTWAVSLPSLVHVSDAPIAVSGMKSCSDYKSSYRKNSQEKAETSYLLWL